MEPTLIVRPQFDAEAYAEREAGRQVRSNRVAEVERLMRHADALSLDIYLEERAAVSGARSAMRPSWRADASQAEVLRRGQA